MLCSLFNFLWKTFAFTTTTVMGVSIAFYIGNYVTQSLIEKDDDSDESDNEYEEDDAPFEDKFDSEFTSLEKGELPSKEEVEKFVSIVNTPIGDVLMTYDFDNETFIYYSERRTIPIRYLDTVCKKFVIDHNCKIFYKEDECVVEEDNTVSEPEPEEKSESLVSDSSEPFYMKFWNSYIYSSGANEVVETNEVAGPDEVVETNEEVETNEVAGANEVAEEKNPDSVFATFKSKKTNNDIKEETTTKNNDVVKVMNKYKCRGTINDYNDNKIKEEKPSDPTLEISFTKFKEMYKNKTE